MDVFDEKKRKAIMSAVKNKHTKDELIVRSLLHRMGYRFRLHKKDLPGSPDIFLKKYKTAIFVNGCFWHGHEGCKRSKLPEKNHAFWANKITINKNRDKKNYEQLRALSINVLVIWTCEIKKKNLEGLMDTINDFITRRTYT